MSSRFARAAVIAGCLFALSGCYTTKFYFAENSGGVGDSHKVLQHTFFWGLVSPGKVDLDGHCGTRGVKKVKSQIGGWGLAANWLTGGIWAPVTVKITCAR